MKSLTPSRGRFFPMGASGSDPGGPVGEVAHGTIFFWFNRMRKVAEEKEPLPVPLSLPLLGPRLGSTGGDPSDMAQEVHSGDVVLLFTPAPLQHAMGVNLVTGRPLRKMSRAQHSRALGTNSFCFNPGGSLPREGGQRPWAGIRVGK